MKGSSQLLIPMGISLVSTGTGFASDLIRIGNS